MKKNFWSTERLKLGIIDLGIEVLWKAGCTFKPVLSEPRKSTASDFMQSRDICAEKKFGETQTY